MWTTAYVRYKRFLPLSILVGQRVKFIAEGGRDRRDNLRRSSRDYEIAGSLQV